ncbi:unnamed protein product [Eruca vesicaria subsp. sativa]|uniref:Receptor ligand binding region domain-containing protein n=1 Tax=Eruca vesicaria subsp. sativa TaxID=29727 RepID=A0ABC8IMC5_ERUVS|nr:unnamed protein product [Eruca vesicaria subsp. sativa]
MLITTQDLWHVRDSLENVVQASAAALDLIKNEQVSAIIGPISSMQAEFVIRLADESQVPAITFSATSPLLTSINSPYFIRATVDDSSQVKAVAAIVKSFGWRNVITVNEDNAFGEGIVPYLADALQDVQAFVVYRSLIPQKANDDQILKELYKLMTMQTRKAREIGMMEEGYVWLLTDGIMNLMTRSKGGSSLENMQGALGVKSHIPKSKELKDFTLRWTKKFKKENIPLVGDDDTELNVFAVWAYDSITALAMAVERARTKKFWYDKASSSPNNRTDLGALGVSRYGPSLQKALSDVKFKGLAGEFKLVNMQRESSAFEIINIIGDEEKKIGCWTPSSGLVYAKPNKTILSPMERFGPVRWPGMSNVVPKGWAITSTGKKLKVGVPLKKGFFNFVKVNIDPVSNAMTPTGYCIDVFEATLRKLPYSVTPQYFAFESPDENYDNMVYQINF